MAFNIQGEPCCELDRAVGREHLKQVPKEDLGQGVEGRKGSGLGYPFLGAFCVLKGVVF